MTAWKIRHVDPAHLVVVVEDVLARGQTPRPLVELELWRVEGDTTIKLKGSHFVALPPAAAAYVAAWMNVPFVTAAPAGFRRADELTARDQDDVAEGGNAP